MRHENGTTALARAAALEAELASAVADAKRELEREVAATPVHGMTRLGGCAFAIRARNLTESWHPAYYDVERQVRRVHGELGNVDTLAGLRGALKAILRDGQEPMHRSVRGVLEKALADVGETTSRPRT